jgi:hypothetical protein
VPDRIAYNEDLPSTKPDSSMLAVLTSSDGGQSWSRLQTAARGSKGQNRPLETVDVIGFQGQLAIA